jgi:hypothetical protein
MNRVTGQAVANVYVNATQALRASSVSLLQFAFEGTEDHKQLLTLQANSNNAHVNWNNAVASLRCLPIEEMAVALNIIEQQLEVHHEY